LVCDVSIETVRNMGYILRISDSLIEERTRLIKTSGPDYDNDFKALLYDEELSVLFQKAATG